MSETYEIGVSLALRDGVSGSIAVMRRDMAAIEAAIGRNAISVTRLRQVAAGLPPRAEKAAQPRALPTAPAEKRRPVIAVAPNEIAAPSPPHAQDAAAAAQPIVALHANAPPLAPPAALRPARTPRESPGVNFVAIADDDRARVAIVPAAAPALQSRAPEAGWPNAARPQERTTAPQDVPSAMRRMEAKSPLPFEHAEAPARRGEMGPAPIPAAPSTAQFVASSQPLAAVMPGDPPRSAWAMFSAMPTMPEPAIPMASMPAAPAPATSPASHVAGAVQPVPARSAEPARTAETGQAPTGGDVFLDGALVGRWLARHLAREAGLPSSGPTGFDPRRNPERPGATLGVQ